MLSVSGHLDDLISLTGAEDASGLWRALVLLAGHATTDHWFAVHLFKRHHADGTPGGITTASLLCTARRTRRSRGRSCSRGWPATA